MSLFAKIIFTYAILLLVIPIIGMATLENEIMQRVLKFAVFGMLLCGAIGLLGLIWSMKP